MENYPKINQISYKGYVDASVKKMLRASVTDEKKDLYRIACKNFALVDEEKIKKLSDIEKIITEKFDEFIKYTHKDTKIMYDSNLGMCIKNPKSKSFIKIKGTTSSDNFSGNTICVNNTFNHEMDFLGYCSPNTDFIAKLKRIADSLPTIISPSHIDNVLYRLGIEKLGKLAETSSDLGFFNKFFTKQKAKVTAKQITQYLKEQGQQLPEESIYKTAFLDIFENESIKSRENPLQKAKRKQIIHKNKEICGL